MDSEHSKSNEEGSRSDFKHEIDIMDLDWAQFEDGLNCSLHSFTTIKDFMEHESGGSGLLLGNEKHKESSTTIDNMKAQSKEPPHDGEKLAMNEASPTKLLPPPPKDMSPGDENFFIDDVDDPVPPPPKVVPTALPKKRRGRMPVIVIPPHIIKSEIGGTPIYKCICGRVFRVKGNVNYHRYCMDPESKPYKCSECPKSFSIRHHFKVHQAIHEPPKLSCRKCGKGYRRLDRLKEHMNSHIGKLPVKCEICHKRFATKATHRNHLSIVHCLAKIIPCDQCERKFKTKRYLRMHQKNMHEEREEESPATVASSEESKSKKKNTKAKISSLMEKLMKAKLRKQKILAVSSKTNQNTQQCSKKTPNSESD